MVSPTALTAAGPLRALLNLYAGHGCPLADLTVLDVSNDPFRVDTPAGHRDGWLATARERFDNQVDQDLLGRLRDEAQDRLAELREQIDALTDAMQIDTGDIDLPPLPAIPDPAVDVGGLPPPLIDSRWEFAGQCRALIDSKAYRNGAAS